MPVSPLVLPPGVYGGVGASNCVLIPVVAQTAETFASQADVTSWQGKETVACSIVPLQDFLEQKSEFYSKLSLRYQDLVFYD